ncbi:MAG: hypothetical protein DRR08_05200 [Candidatus Parabeggiatoa sp. nov. 2]|nr:MAG: hypothetical protein B6247_18395 [Beggiatoa sp. 4572_84]RKZ62764.1 MAG: hypothetical protein DRR08_05200 [Gammaproteobacteria bacterium]
MSKTHLWKTTKVGAIPCGCPLSKLRQQVLEHPDWFQYEHAQTFGVTQSAISKALAKLGITHKKKTFHYDDVCRGNPTCKARCRGNPTCKARCRSR